MEIEKHQPVRLRLMPSFFSTTRTEKLEKLWLIQFQFDNSLNKLVIFVLQIQIE
jgi:hypothetical protein